MKLWIDAQLSFAIAAWMTMTFGVEAIAVRDLGFREATDLQIFAAARAAGAIVMTKDRDFVLLVEQRGSPPQVVWITCGNTSNARLKQVLETAWPRAVALLESGEPIVEITDALP